MQFWHHLVRNIWKGIAERIWNIAKEKNLLVHSNATASTRREFLCSVWPGRGFVPCGYLVSCNWIYQINLKLCYKSVLWLFQLVSCRGWALIVCGHLFFPKVINIEASCFISQGRTGGTVLIICLKTKGLNLLLTCTCSQNSRAAS